MARRERIPDEWRLSHCRYSGSDPAISLSVQPAYRPKVIVYDIAPPYDRNWAFFLHLRQTILGGYRFVLTSVNVKHVQALVGRPTSARRSPRRSTSTLPTPSPSAARRSMTGIMC